MTPKNDGLFSHVKAILALILLILFHKDFCKKDDDGYVR